MSRTKPPAVIWIVATLCFGVLPGATCDVEDVAPSVEIAFTGDGDVPATSFEHPYTGRLSADWKVEVDDPAPASVTVDWQVRTTGHEDDEACVLLRSSSGRRVQLAPLRPGGVADADLSELALVRDLGTPLLFSFEEGLPEGTAGAFRLQVPRDSRFLATSLDATTSLEVRTPSGTTVQPALDRAAGPGCPEGRTRSFDLESGTYVVLISSESVEARALIREECASVRLVQRTCPGSAGEIHRTDIDSIATDQPVRGSLSAELLGIGDLMTVRASCSPEPCSGRLTVVRLLRPIECLASSDCPGSEICTQDGFCETGASGGCSVTSSMPRTPGPLFLAVLVLGMLFLSRRLVLARHGPAVLGTLLVLMMFHLAEPASASTGSEVFLSAGTGTNGFTGELGDATSAGMSLRLMQGLQFRRFGLFLDIRRDFMLTTQDGPPYQHGLQLSRTALGARFRQPIGPLMALIGAEYWRLNFLNNPLVDITGPATLYHGVGGHIAARWDIAAPLYIEAQTGVSSAPGMRSTTVLVEGLLSLGVAGALRERR